MPLRVTLAFSGGDPRCFDEPETYYSFSLCILCRTSWGMPVVFHNVLEKVEIQMSGRRAEYIIADKDTWSNLRGKYFKVGPTGPLKVCQSGLGTFEKKNMIVKYFFPNKDGMLKNGNYDDVLLT